MSSICVALPFHLRDEWSIKGINEKPNARRSDTLSSEILPSGATVFSLCYNPLSELWIVRKVLIRDQAVTILLFVLL